MSTESRVCPFCSSVVKGKKSREHVFPRWLLRILTSKRIAVRTSHFNREGEESQVRQHTLDELVLGGVCRDCNHGWMSELEQSARPILHSLIVGTRSLETLEAHQRFVLSRWAVKTAITLNLSSGFERQFTVEVVHGMAKDPLTIPAGVYAFAAQGRPRVVIDWLQAAGITFYTPEEAAPAALREQLANNALRVGLLIGSLCLIVVYWPHAGWPLTLWPGVHELLWPPEADIAYSEHQYPGETAPLDVSPRLFLFRAMMNLGVMRDPPQGTIRMFQKKNAHTFISGPEPGGSESVLPIPTIITPEIDTRIKDWLREQRKPFSE